MKLIEYLKLYKNSIDFDIPDNEIDYTVTICYENKDFDPHPFYSKREAEYIFYDRFCSELLSKVELDYLLGDGTPVCKFTSLILNNKEAYLQFAKEHWEERYYEAVKDDDAELCFQFIKEFDNTAGGRYGEEMNKAYYELLKESKYHQLEMSLKTNK